VVEVEQLAACTLTDHRWYSHRGVTGGTRDAVPGAERRPGRFAGLVRLLR
jgi:hypothetical protein